MKIFIKQQSANGLIFSRPTHLLIGKLANLLIFLLIFTLANLLIFTGCSKSDNNDTPEAPSTVQTPEHLTDWKPQPKVEVAQPYMAFATGSASATTLSLTAVGTTASATDVWVDTNNNGIFDEGVDKRITDFSKPITFTAANGLFTVYGKVKELTATGNALTAADVRKNEALTKLNVADNQLSEKALLNLVNSLPATTASGTTAVVLRKDTDERNTVTEAVLIAAKQRGWQALKVEKGKEVPDLPADTQAPKVGAITEATATAFNSVLVKWTAATDNKTVAEKLRYQVLYNVKGSSEVKTSELKENMLVLTLTGLTEKTTYVVKVKVMDEAGNTAEYQAKEVTTPAESDTQAPTPAAISDRITVTDQTATLSWETATDNRTSFDDLRYQVFWKAQGSTEVQNSGTPQAAMFSYVIKGLAPNTTYTVWVEVFDKAGNKAKYPEKTFTTAKKEEPKPEPKDTHYIVLTTQKTVGEKVKLNINAAEEDQAGVWLDLNGNGKWDEGIDQKPTKFLQNIEYTLQAQTFRIYGKVWHLDCQNNQLTAIDISQNAALTRLLIEGNNLSSIAHLEHLKELSIDSHTLLASSLPKELTFLRINETTPLTTINTSPFTELNSLDIDNCKNLKSLDLSNNKRLVTLYISNTGLTTLDLSHQPQLRNLYADSTPLTKLNIAGNKALKYVYIKLTQEGKGLQGEALMDFLKQLPTHEKGKEGRMHLRRTQATDAVKNYLASKFWKVDAR